MKTISATERIKLWNKFSGPIDQETVKLEFFRKIHCKNPPFRVKRLLPQKDRVIVPKSVETHYRNPPELVAALKNVLRIENVLSTQRTTKFIQSLEALAHDIDDDLRAIQEANRKLENIENDVDEVIESDNKDSEMSREGQSHHEILILEKDFSDEFVVETEEVIDYCETSNDCEAEPYQQRNFTLADAARGTEEIDLLCDEVIAPEFEQMISYEPLPQQKKKVNEAKKYNERIIDDELNNLDPHLIKLLALQRLQQLVNHNPDVVNRFRNRTIADEIRTAIQKDPQKSMVLPSQLLKKEDIERIAREFSGVESEPNENLAETLDPNVSEQANGNGISINNEDDVAGRIINEDNSQIRARAAITPLNDLLQNYRYK